MRWETLDRVREIDKVLRGMERGIVNCAGAKRVMTPWNGTGFSVKIAPSFSGSCSGEDNGLMLNGMAQ